MSNNKDLLKIILKNQGQVTPVASGFSGMDGAIESARNGVPARATALTFAPNKSNFTMAESTHEGTSTPEGTSTHTVIPTFDMGNNKNYLLGQEYLNKANNLAFNFDLNGNALYNQYKDQYTKAAKLGMEDAIGRAAALTGGYGNSYAMNAGQQAYYSQMDNLNNIIPQLYDMAYGQYRDQKSDLLNMASYYNGLAQQDQQNYIDQRNADLDAQELALKILQSGEPDKEDPLANVPKSVFDIISKYTLNGERDKKLDELISGKVIDAAAAKALASMYNVSGQGNFFQMNEDDDYQLDDAGNLIPIYSAMLASPELWKAGENTGGINWFGGIDGNAELITPTGITVTGDELLALLMNEGMNEEEARSKIRALQIQKGLTGKWFE